MLQLYHGLPTPLWSVAASLRGFHLRAWRYGRETDGLVDAALERERWSVERWRSWQEEQVARLLHRAAVAVPYYRDHWTARRRRGDRASWELLEHWPLLSKATVRAQPTAFLADDCGRRLFPEHTSGTTGTPLKLWWTRDVVRNWYALFEARWRRWHGVSRHDRWAILGGQLVVPVSRKRPPYWVSNAGLRQLYLSTHHLAPATIAAYIDAMGRFRARYVYGYPSALHALAVHAPADAARALGLRVALTNAEPLYPWQRQAIERSLQCPVRETYGMAEIVTAAGECERGHLHLWPDVGIVEVMRDDGIVAGEGRGELVCTGLVNTAMPLIRYRVGDRAEVPPPAEACPCGRRLPLIQSLDGRADDVLQTADGRLVGRLDPVFKADLRLQEAQVIQETRTSLRVRYVPAAGFGADDERAIVAGLRDRLGPVEVTLEPVALLPRGANGKFRAVVCRVGRAPDGAA
jgi:phenylacetate-CoA ligase